MKYASLFFSLLFFTSFAFYLFFGLYVIHWNPRSRLNRMFLAVCISLCFWSFGFSMANSAPDIETCLLWRRVSSLGWATVYSILLHFVLLLTWEKCTSKQLKRNFLLHIPAFIGVYVFAVSGEITSTQYNLVNTNYGWVNIAARNGWTLFFNTYYIVYVLASVLLVWRWRLKSSDESIHKQANLILTSLLVALFLGSMTDVVLSANLSIPLPQMAPVFTLMPVAAIMHSIKRYGMMREVSAEENELILSSEMRARLSNYLSIAFLAGGLLSFLSVFLPQMIIGEENLRTTIYTGGLLFIFGLAIQGLHLVRTEKIRDLSIFIITLFSIPVITLRFLEYSAVTVWAFPIVLMTLSLVFSTRIPLVMATATSVITQILVWVYAPQKAIMVDRFDHILRIGIFIIAFWIGSIVNKTYLKKLKENIYQADFQRLISEISYDFVSIKKSSMDEKINEFLYKIGRFFKVDRAYVFFTDNRNNTMTCTFEWCNGETEPEAGSVRDVPQDIFPWWMKQLKENKLINIENISKLTDEARTEKERLARRNVKAALVIPIEVNGELLGFIGFDSAVSPRKWSNQQIDLLRILANLLADGLIKIKAEKDMEYMAYYDHLTGLPNRMLFSDRLNQAIYLAKRTEKFIGVMFMDLDSFKAVNDTVGHMGGDIILKEVAQGLVGCLRKADTIARFGGDEYLIMVSNISDSKDIIKIAKNVMELFEKSFMTNGQELYVTSSVGIAVYPFDGEDAETLIRNADIAMYKAKSKGKNQFALCTTNMKMEVKENMMLSNNLFRAMERGELIVYYQPQIKLNTGQIVGLEALLRWKHPKMGMISPGIFIPLAENNGLIHSIGEWVLKMASSQNKKWQDMGLPHLRMAVNLSVSQFNNPRIVDNVGGILKETGLSPKYLELEITESTATKEANYTIDVLNKLKKIGVTISIDDFGTEYSSLNRLKMLPVDRIKIDMQFVQGIDINEKDQAITKVIISLAKSLGIEVLAEGVETESQLGFLNKESCDEVQGFYYYKPMSAEDIEIILKSAANSIEE